MLVLAIILISIICVCLVLIYLILKKDLFKNKRHSIDKKIVTPTKKLNENNTIVPASSDVEVLELYPGKQNGLVSDINDDSLNLNELFKTISMEAIHDDANFEVGLRRDEKK